MKMIIDEDTGELIEVENKNEIISKKLLEVGAIDKETFEMIEMFLYYKDQYETFKYLLGKAMKENKINKWDNELFLAYIVPESMSQKVDTERLKADGLYDKYSMFVPVKEHLTIKMKGNK